MVKIFLEKHVFFSKFWVIRLLKKKFPISMCNYIFQCSTSVHNLQQKGSTPPEVQFVPKNTQKMCVRTTGTSQKFAIFDQKIVLKSK